MDPKKPVLILSHIPIASVAVFYDGENAKEGNWMIPGSWMHIDSAKIIELFSRYSNIKVCLSGHLHLVDEVKYNGITYLCNGAVSGAWWKGKYHQTDAGYAMVDLFDDGSFERKYVPYGWEAIK
jgi:Icc protein